MSSNLRPRFNPVIVTFVPPSKRPYFGVKSRISGSGQKSASLSQESSPPSSQYFSIEQRPRRGHHPHLYLASNKLHSLQLSAITSHLYRTTRGKKTENRWSRKSSTVVADFESAYCGCLLDSPIERFPWCSECLRSRSCPKRQQSLLWGLALKVCNWNAPYHSVPKILHWSSAWRHSWSHHFRRCWSGRQLLLPLRIPTARTINGVSKKWDPREHWTELFCTLLLTYHSILHLHCHNKVSVWCDKYLFRIMVDPWAEVKQTLDTQRVLLDIEERKKMACELVIQIHVKTSSFRRRGMGKGWPAIQQHML